MAIEATQGVATSAQKVKCAYIITRNKRGFADTPIPVLPLANP